MKLVPTTPFTRGYLRGLERARADTQRLIALVDEKGPPEWRPGLECIEGWLGKLIEARAVMQDDLPPEERSEHTPPTETPTP